jgi:hypothetical protein
MQEAQTGEWRRYGFGGPPEPWDHGAHRALDRLATSYYVDVLETRRRVLAKPNGARTDRKRRRTVDELLAEATRHKHEIDFALRHWATPAEATLVEDRLGSLMRISRRMRSLAGDSARR